MIKHLSITIAIIFLSFGQLSAQTTAQQIANISKHVTRVNTIQLQRKHYEFMCDEKMKVDYYYDKGQIVKISLDYGTIGDVYACEDHYYQNGKLIFVYEFVEGGPACEGCIKKNEYRSYIYNSKVIRYLKNRSVAKCRKCQFGPASKQYKLLKVKTEAEIKRVLCGVRR
ncbi:hypothetical protein [Mucilaginibacter myungsuensis]|nr:hypothetical protein [Mucilaginibacter myungsuensis]MDN3598534.1 hypothetical protein [Mucilaginibacter myungsuensis]